MAIRSGTGISNISVDAEVDPGFGPDTEQRRVEFAAKLEEEAFAISLGDATKLAGANLTSALKLWGQKKLIPLVKKLDLRQIMIIWLIFEYVYLVTLWKNLSEKEFYLENVKNLNKLLKAILTPLAKDISEKNLEGIEKIREEFGGDLIFSLKEKNKSEVVKIYEITYSKLPKSLRARFFDIISGIEIRFKELSAILKSKEPLEKIITLVVQKLKRIEEYNSNPEKITNIASIVEAFSPKAAEILKQAPGEFSDKGQEEVKEKVKKYYGIE